MRLFLYYNFFFFFGRTEASKQNYSKPISSDSIGSNQFVIVIYIKNTVYAISYLQIKYC